MSDTELKFVSLFVEPECADAFLLGFAFGIASILIFVCIGFAFDLFYDMVRCKLGLPVARYVRWVKEQNKLDKGGESDA